MRGLHKLFLVFIHFKGHSIAVEIPHGVLNLGRSSDVQGFDFGDFCSLPNGRNHFHNLPWGLHWVSYPACVHSPFWNMTFCFETEIVPTNNTFPSEFQKWPTHYWIIRLNNHSFSDSVQGAASIALGLNQEITGWCSEGVCYPRGIIYPYNLT